MNEPTVFTVPVHTKQPAKIGENVTFSLISPTVLPDDYDNDDDDETLFKCV